MPSDSAAVVIACISGVVSLAAAGGVEWSRRRTTGELHKRDAALLRLRSDHDTKLAQFEHDLAQRREAATHADEAARLVAKYRDPLLRSAFDLHSRIYNLHSGFRGRRDPEYFRLNTLFLLADFLGWLEIVRREMQFLDLGAVDATKELGLMLSRVQSLLARSSASDDDWYIYRGEQRAIGELMLRRVDGDVPGTRRHECMGYAAFVAAQETPEFARWFERLGNALEPFPDECPPWLVDVHDALIDLIDCLDPDHIRFTENRDRLKP